MYRKYLKRIFDLVAALVGLILLLPVFLIITLLLFVVNKGKPFYFQERIGLKGEIFKIIKFKTMNDKKDVKGNLLPDVMRLTKLGDFVRRHSLDELPQFINVLKGDMSIVGPRPLIIQYMDLYSNRQMKRHDVMPGITGWAQVNGRNAITWTKKFELDLFYIENLSFKMDLQILIKTVYKVFSCSDINRSQKMTAPFFNGKN